MSIRLAIVNQSWNYAEVRPYTSLRRELIDTSPAVGTLAIRIELHGKKEEDCRFKCDPDCVRGHRSEPTIARAQPENAILSDRQNPSTITSCI